MKKTLHWSDFYPSTARKTSLKSRKHADLNFDLDASALSTSTPVVPSLTLDLASELTGDHPLQSRHLARGKADVDYWFEAIFVKQSRTVHAVAGAVHVPEPSSLRLMPRSMSQQLCFSASKPSRLAPFGMTGKKASGQHCNLQVQLKQDIGAINNTRARVKDNAKLHIPIRVEVKDRTSHAPLKSLTSSGAECSITAKWYVTRFMSTGPKRQQHHGTNAISRCSVITQTSSVVVPPFYEHPTAYDDMDQKTSPECSADALIELCLPKTAIAPTVSLPGLSIQYDLELQLAFKTVQPKSPEATEPAGFGSVSLKIPVALEGV